MGFALFILLWNQCGYLFWSIARTGCYHYVRQHRKAIAMRDTIVIDKATYKGNADLVWMKHDEVRYKGQMFDIKHSYERDGYIVLAGHYDKLENKLFKILFKWLANDDDDGKDKHNRQQQWCFDVLLPTHTFSLAYYPSHTVTRFPAITLHMPHRWRTVDLQPPEVFLS